MPGDFLGIYAKKSEKFIFNAGSVYNTVLSIEHIFRNAQLYDIWLDTCIGKKLYRSIFKMSEVKENQPGSFTVEIGPTTVDVHPTRGRRTTNRLVL